MEKNEVMGFGSNKSVYSVIAVAPRFQELAERIKKAVASYEIENDLARSCAVISSSRLGRMFNTLEEDTGENGPAYAAEELTGSTDTHHWEVTAVQLRKHESQTYQNEIQYRLWLCTTNYSPLTED